MRVTYRASRAASTPLSVHALTNSSPETTGRFHSRPLAVPVVDSVPRNLGESASALTYSGPPRRSLALRPGRSLSRPRRTFSTKVLQSISLPSRTALIAIDWNDQLGGWVYPLLGCGALARHTSHFVCAPHGSATAPPAGLHPVSPVQIICGVAIRLPSAAGCPVQAQGRGS